ncbi:Transmembrane protein [Globisporangium polare]
MCQAFMGAGLALAYNLALFSCFTPRTSASVTIPSGEFYQNKRTFSSSPYWVNLHDFHAVPPSIMLSAVTVLLLPFEANTRKFAMDNNLYFETASQLYFLVGFAGTCISVLIMTVPYRILNKSEDHVSFLKNVLHRKFEARRLRTSNLVKNIWRGGDGDVTARTFPASALAFVPLSPSSLRRQQQHDKSSSPSANEVAANMKTEYVQWLVQIRRYERASMEQLLLLSCLVSGAEGIPRNFSALEEVVVAS